MPIGIGLNVRRLFLCRIWVSKIEVDNTKFWSDLFLHETWKDRRLTVSEQEGCKYINLVIGLI